MSAADLNGSREKTVMREKRLHKFSTRQTCETAAETTKSTNLSEVTVDALKTSSQAVSVESSDCSFPEAVSVLKWLSLYNLEKCSLSCLSVTDCFHQL